MAWLVRYRAYTETSSSDTLAGSQVMGMYVLHDSHAVHLFHSGKWPTQRLWRDKNLATTVGLVK